MLAPITMTECHGGGYSTTSCDNFRSDAPPAGRNQSSLDALARWVSPDSLAKRAHVGADTRGVHSVVTPTLAAGGTHVDAASVLITDDPDDDIVGEAEPTALLARPDATCTDIGGNDGPARHRCRDIKGLVERHRHRQRRHDRHHIGVGSLLQLRELLAAIVDTTCTLSRACR